MLSSRFVRKTGSVALALIMAIGIFILPSKEVKAASSSVEEFIIRCYWVTLGRDPDESGKKYWIDELDSFRQTGTSIAANFMYSEEYQGLKKTDEDYVADLYHMFMGRDPDSDGNKYWLNELSKGTSRDLVFTGFANSEEFESICRDYDILAGYFSSSYDLNKLTKINYFVDRVYYAALDRYSDRSGQQFWAEGLANGNLSGVSLVSSFVQSKEFNEKYIYADEYLTRLYNVFMLREPDKAGMDYWLAQVEAGMSKDALFANFAKAPEFSDLCSSFDIPTGTYKMTNDPTGFNGNITRKAEKDPNFIVLSGKYEDIITIDKNCYCEGEDVVLFFLKGTVIHGDTLNLVEKVMKENEALLGLKYRCNFNTSRYTNWKGFYLGDENAFSQVNTDRQKAELIITCDPQDGSIEGASDSYCILFDYDVDSKSDSVSTLIHEMTHVLTLRNGADLGPTMDEGMAMFVQDAISRKLGYTDADLIPYMSTNELFSADYLKQGEDMIKMSYDRTGIIQPEYQCGLRFCYFIYKNYGASALANIINESSRLDTDNDYNISQKDVVKAIKKGTSDDVFVKFEKWIVDENGWKEFDSIIIEHVTKAGHADWLP
ncbi:MAG: DUF4214 domain-containing protein [Clostridiales bacterium]|nr:DUF4214 domain-containing protein [Clostridiales bacterium]